MVLTNGERKRTNLERMRISCPLDSTPIGADLSGEDSLHALFLSRLWRQKRRKRVFGDTPNPGRETLHPLIPRL
jgi:hypothetical protein